jgi:branched-chain amino acid transport system substrate-binding protein
VRTGGANVSHAAVIADFAIKRGLKRVYIAVADFLPGHEMQGVYQARIAAAGGTILGQDRIPLSTVDYAPFAERIAGAKPDAVLCFIPNGAPAVAWFKSLGEQGVLAAKIPILGVAETDDSELAKFDNSVAGVAHSTIFYSAGADNDANRKFKEAFAKKFPGASLSAGIATAFDGIHVLYSMVASQKGKPFDKLDAFKAVQGMEWAAPRGPLRIAPGTGDLDTPIFVRRAELVDGKLVNVIVDTVIARAGG